MRGISPLVLLTVLLVTTSLWAQDPVLTQLIDPVSLSSDGTTLTIIFDDLEEDDTTNFEAQHSDNITVWTGIPTGTVAPHATIAHRYVLTAADPGGDRKFYRILAYSTTAEDRDGDGLSDVFEVTLGTNASKADSDNDGFDDGVEFANGTDPNDANSFPDLAHLPAVEFDEVASVNQEGSGTLQIPFTFNRPFTGTVTYSLHATTTAVEGTDIMPVSGSVSVSGTSGSIPITSIDNEILNRDRLIAIDLESTSDYRVGGTSRHVICLCDNDAYWSGNIVTGRMTRNFRAEITRANGTTKVFFVAGKDHDGLGDPTGGDTSQSDGLIPEGRHPATVVADTSTSFEVTVTLPSVQQSKFFGDSLTLERTLTFTSAPGTDDLNYDEISDYRVRGCFAESCNFSLSNSSAPAGCAGQFTIVRNAPEPITIPTF